MDNLILVKISYGDLKTHTIPIYDDKYHLITDYLTPSTYNALLDNPNNIDDSKTALNLLIYNGCIVGRNMLMPTAIKIDEEIVYAQSGGSFEISEQYRGRGLGSLAFQDSIFNSEYPIYIGQLYSSGAISILKKMEVCIFGKPLYNKNRKMRSVLVARGYKGLKLIIRSFCGDIVLHLSEIPNRVRLIKLKHNYIIRREIKVPEWVNEITLHDGHRYMEVHDRDWLQWNLDHVFSQISNDKNYFYAVYDKSGKPAGFYMTKERFEENKKGTFKNLVRGTLVEWGSYDENILTEFDLNIMAFSTFSSRVDKVNTVISSHDSEKIMEKL